MFKKERLTEKFLARMEGQFGSHTVKNIVAAFGKKRQPTFRVNTIKTNDEETTALLRAENIAYERIKNVPHAFRVRNRTSKELLEHQLCREGKIYLQGLASMLPALVLDPKPDEAILDLCAAPGSKTSQIAAIISSFQSPIFNLLACEENEIRFQKLQNTLRLQGADFVKARNCDASLLHKELPETFDKILADVPCSAEGRINLNDPRSYSFWSEKNIIAHARLQRRLLRSAVACLKPGGTLVYSTCTLAPEENGEMIEWLLSTFPKLKTEAFKLPYVATRFGPANSLYVLPTIENEGLFVAKIKKSRD